jgi:hypothetical protein
MKNLKIYLWKVLPIKYSSKSGHKKRILIMQKWWNKIREIVWGHKLKDIAQKAYFQPAR